MKLPRPRLTIRRLMIAVAVVAVVIGVGVEAVRLARLSAAYRLRAEECEFSLNDSVMVIRTDDGPPVIDPVCIRRREYLTGLAKQYRHAARYPWLPVPPDPPYPE